MSASELWMDRFCGREVYPITAATWALFLDDERGPGTVSVLCLRVEAGLGTAVHEDTEELRTKPFWTIAIAERGLTLKSLTSGATFAVPHGYDKSRGEFDYATNFYYGTHEVSDQNTVEIIDVIDDRLLLRLRGQIVDVNYDDGSKPASDLFAETWFDKRSKWPYPD